MPRRSTLYRNDDTGIQIQISRPAEFMIGPMNVAKFVTTLYDLMEALTVKTAYVSKRGCAIDVHLVGGPFISKHFKIERGDVYDKRF